MSDAHAPPDIDFDGTGSSSHNESSLVLNPWSWSNFANVLYLEAPCGVGFSYSHVKADLTNGDNQTAYDNLMALESFFKKYSALKSNPFYVSGESYGGVYVPTLSLKIYEAGASFGGNMQGYLVGNGVFDGEDAAGTTVPFLYGHGMMSTAMHTQIVSTCNGQYVNPSSDCKKLLDAAEELVVDTNGYDIYRACYHPAEGKQSFICSLPNR